MDPSKAIKLNQTVKLKIDIERDATTPAYQQIEAGIRDLIRQGTLRPGDRLPTTRELAHDLQVNRSTVVAAYKELIRAGSAAATVGRGTFIADRSATAEPAAAERPAGNVAQGTAGTDAADASTDSAVHSSRRTADRLSPAAVPAGGAGWPPQLSRAIESAARVVTQETVSVVDHPQSVDFGALAPDEALFPIDEFQELLTRLMRERGRELLQYGPTQGDATLRQLIAGELRQADMPVDANQVVIVHGIQQGIDLTLRVLLDPGDTVVVESPTYVSVLPSLNFYRAEVVSIPMTPGGLDAAHLERIASRRRPKLIYTMPNFQNPTGVTMDLDTRRRVMDIATRLGIPILEDDYEKDLRLHGDALPCLKAMDTAGLVIHMGTFSKGLFPGLRIGWIAAPAALVKSFHLAKRISDLHTGLLMQAAVAEFCADGHYARHVDMLLKVYRRRQQVLLEAMGKQFPAGVTWTRPEGGFVVWLTLPERLNADDIVRDAHAEGVVATPGSYFFHESQGEHHLRLSFARTDEAAIERGICVLGEVMTRHLAEERGIETTQRMSRALPQL